MDQKRRHSRVLVWAAIYNILWGAFIIAFPNALFNFAGLPLPSYPEIWQCVGMIVGVYGLGYYFASWDPYRHWPIVLVGFLGKIFGPIGFVGAIYRDVFNWKFALTIITNDLIWWVPFFSMLYAAYKKSENKWQQDTSVSLDALKLNDGKTLLNESQNNPVFVLLMRHSGCTFCRATLDQLSQQKKSLSDQGVKTVIVHMGDETSGQFLQDKYDLRNIEFVSDPNKVFYNTFEMSRASFFKAFELNSWTKGFKEGVLRGHGVGGLDGDGFQMGGWLVLDKGKVKHIHRSKNVADTPNWDEVLELI